MNAILVDDDELCLEMEAVVIRETGLFEKVDTFSKIEPLIEYFCANPVDVAFLDIIMEDVDGISLAMELKRIQPDCDIIFVSSSRDYALEAFGVYASGYLLKPLTKEDVITVVEHL